MVTIMPEKKLAATFLLCVCVLHPRDTATAQNVTSTFDHSVDFKNYKKYAWGSNYLLTRQTREDQERINMAIVDSINRNLQARGFAEDDKSPEFRITYEAGGLLKADVTAQRKLYAADTAVYSLGNVGEISPDAWVYILAKLQITVTDAATNRTLWQAMASQKIRDSKKFGNSLKENVDKFIQRTMKSFPPTK